MAALQESLPVWGAWIEIAGVCWACTAVPGRSPYGERGLKLGVGGAIVFSFSRSPYGSVD